MKVMTILGTRPEIIRLSRIISLLDKYCTHILVHTGQNYDYELNEVFFKDLEIRKPDYFLSVDVSSLGSVLGDTIIKSEEVLKKEKPDAVLILGDTNSSIACIIAKRLKIPIFHMEAGNRCFDPNVPEEINRAIIDHISDYNLVYTEHARRNLLREGLPPRRIYLTGSPLMEVLSYYSDNISKSRILNQLKIKPKEYFLFSFHREENVDNSDNLLKILKIIELLKKKYSKEIIISTHPRTKKRIEKLSVKHDEKNIRFLKPFGFFDYVQLQKNSLCVISDSGTISEESAILQFPAITIRDAMERPEAMDAGSIILTGFDEETVLKSVNIAISEDNNEIPQDYLNKNTSQRVLKLIIGLARLSNSWSCIKKNDLN